MVTFPTTSWRRAQPSEAGLDGAKLESLGAWLAADAALNDHRVLVVRRGYLVGEWQRGLDASQQVPLASAAKSVYSCILGIAITEGRIPSADARVADFYPEMMEVPPGKGPKEGRYAFAKDEGITFRQLISNTSGYMKPDEEPGRVFHYQTYGMNLVTHALGSIYGVYDTNAPGETPGFGRLIDRYIAGPIWARWAYTYMNFRYPPGARGEVFGNYCQIHSTARDMARLGWLWANWGRWEGRQLVPEGWLREATRVAPAIRANYPEADEARRYGYAFWTNEERLLWPSLPQESYAAVGAGRQLIWVCPSKDLVVVQGPGPYQEHHDAVCVRVLQSVLDAVVA